jgi:hypothetical protein
LRHPIARHRPMRLLPGEPDNRPLLEGQSEIHMKEQLQAFASEQRRNDISAQMRNIARAMTPRRSRRRRRTTPHSRPIS